MAIALRSTRFVVEHASLEVREMPDRATIQILTESGPPMAPD
jgi:hypothetical protein